MGAAHSQPRSRVQRSSASSISGNAVSPHSHIGSNTPSLSVQPDSAYAAPSRPDCHQEPGFSRRSHHAMTAAPSPMLRHSPT